MLTSTDERGYTTTFTYDGANGHLLTITNALSLTTTLAYDGSTGLLSTSTDPLRHVVTNTYDAYRRLATSTDVLGTTSLTYDSTTGEVVTVTDPLSRVTTFAYVQTAETASFFGRWQWHTGRVRPCCCHWASDDWWRNAPACPTGSGHR